eukprot:5548537-Pleurochrysis_carterae.AAC.2
MDDASSFTVVLFLYTRNLDVFAIFVVGMNVSFAESLRSEHSQADACHCRLLNNNDFEGTIPASLFDLTSLSYWCASYLAPVAVNAAAIIANADSSVLVDALAGAHIPINSAVQSQRTC